MNEPLEIKNELARQGLCQWCGGAIHLDTARCIKCAGEDLDERESLEAERDKYLEAIRSFAGVVLSTQLQNTPEWMEYLAEKVNDLCETIGEEDRFTFNHDRLVKFKP